ncbi:MAG: OsmC family protein [Comamonadaceae bacterium]|nr:OsmC family protein [Comamonadaceae bacterium]
MSAGGDDAGPSPYELLLSALGACTAMTLRMYADLKKLPLKHISVELRHEKIHAEACQQCETKEGKIDRIERIVTLEGDLSDEQRNRLLEIANKCPVHRTLAFRGLGTDVAGATGDLSRSRFASPPARKYCLTPVAALHQAESIGSVTNVTQEIKLEAGK